MDFTKFDQNALSLTLLTEFNGNKEKMAKAFFNSMKRHLEENVTSYDWEPPCAVEKDVAKEIWNGVPRDVKQIIFGYLFNDPLALLNTKLVCKRWNEALKNLTLPKLIPFISSNELERENEISFFTIVGCGEIIIPQDGSPCIPLSTSSSFIKVSTGDKDGTIRTYAVVNETINWSLEEDADYEKRLSANLVSRVFLGQSVSSLQNWKRGKQNGAPFRASIQLVFTPTGNEEETQTVTIPVKILGRTQLSKYKKDLANSSNSDDSGSKCGKCGELFPINYDGVTPAKFCNQCGEPRYKKKRKTDIYVKKNK